MVAKWCQMEPSHKLQGHYGCHYGRTVPVEKSSTQYAKGGGFPSVYLTYLYRHIIINHKILAPEGIKTGWPNNTFSRI